MSDLSNTHRALLERWRTRMNLVGPGPVQVHFDDCRRALAGLEPEGRWVDLGSGAGFPGLVLAALHPELQVELVDSRRKRCVFLERVLAEAGVGGRVRVRCQRVEALEPGAYDGVTARAFASPEEVLEHGARLLRSGGRVVLFLQDDAPVPPHPAFTLEAERPYGLDDGRRRRSAVLRRA